MVYANVIGCDLDRKLPQLVAWLRYSGCTYFREEYDYQLGILLPYRDYHDPAVLFVTLAALALRLSFTL